MESWEQTGPPSVNFGPLYRLVGRSQEEGGHEVFGSGLPGLVGAPPGSRQSARRPDSAQSRIDSARSSSSTMSFQRAKVLVEQVEPFVEQLVRPSRVKHVLLIVTKGELGVFAFDFCKYLQESGLQVTVLESLSSNGALACVLKTLGKSSTGSVLVACPSGQVRTSTVGALWLHHKYKMTFSEAINTVTRTPGVIRRPSMTDLLNLVDPGLALQLAPVDRQGRPATAPATAPAPPSVQSANSDQILFLTTGGTIDKDYPRLTGGYAFEIGTPAVSELLHSLQQIHAINFSYSVLSICRKDSQDIESQDREKIIQQCVKTKAKKIIITHGTDTIIETGQYLLQDPVLQQQAKTVILTGALRPSKFSFSDAGFNLGTALGALDQIETGGLLGVYIAMGGQILDVRQGVKRDKSSGVFQRA